MYNDKKGLSAILVTIILVALALVLITVFWGSITEVIGVRTEQIDYLSKCLDANLEVKVLECIGLNCNVTIDRTMGTKGEIDGVGLTFSNASGATSTENVNAFNTNFNSLTKKSVTTTIVNATEVSARAYFKDEADVNYFCTPDTFP